ncbi:MAG: hypothetical protein ACREX8_08800, partial [Gammaproteobacteria bacterium]
ILDALRGFQALVGELHDDQVFLREVSDSLESAAGWQAHRVAHALRAWAPEDSILQTAEHGAPQAGLLGLARQLRRRAEERFRTLATEWLKPTGHDFLRHVEGLAAALRVG